MNSSLFLVYGAVVVAGFLGYHRIHAGQQAQQQVIRAQIAQEKVDQQAQQSVESALVQVEAYRRRLPPEPNPSWLVQAVTEAAQKSGITLLSLSPDAPQEQKSFTRLTARFQFAATYHELGQFIARLETAPQLIRVDRVDIVPGAGKSSVGSVRMSVSTLFVPGG